jgi:hypothetical protein
MRPMKNPVHYLIAETERRLRETRQSPQILLWDEIGPDRHFTLTATEKAAPYKEFFEAPVAKMRMVAH